MTSESLKKMTPETKIVHTGRCSKHHFGVVNTPVYRASTILFDDYQAFKNLDYSGKRPWYNGGLTYGRKGTPLTYQLEQAILDIEGGDHCLLTASGVAAISVVMSAFLSPNDHVLISDNVYGPTKMWAEHFGSRFGIDYTFFSPCITENDFKALIQPNTKLVMFESPGSLTFEITDIPALAKIAKEYNPNIITAIDNSWSAGYFFKPFEKGCDVSIQAGTKYYIGHSDGLFGSITCKADVFNRIRETHYLNGHTIDGDTAYLALRGIRTLSVRLKQHEKNALDVARYLESRDDVKAVLHPALESFPHHALFKRDFTGSSGLFSFVMNNIDEKAIERFINNLQLFGIGFSWGGFESLVMPCLRDNMQRSCKGYVDTNDIVIRLHIGLEDSSDLINDLANAFATMYV
jgi:cysteine-S-conjugate beta-lyase